MLLQVLDIEFGIKGTIYKQFFTKWVQNFACIISHKISTLGANAPRVDITEWVYFDMIFFFVKPYDGVMVLILRRMMRRGWSRQTSQRSPGTTAGAPRCWRSWPALSSSLPTQETQGTTSCLFHGRMHVRYNLKLFSCQILKGCNVTWSALL